MVDLLRILLADDHNVVRSGLRALIDAQHDMEVVGEASDGEVACRLASELRPDVTILDLSMPVVGGARAAERIVGECPGSRILALTVHEDRGYLQQALRAGASGYLLKRAAAAELIHAIRCVAGGGSYLDPRLASRLIEDISGRVASPSTPLSEREEEVLRLIARGYTNREISDRLDLSVKTVETHRSRSMEKLNLSSRAEIVTYAIRSGWLEGP